MKSTRASSGLEEEYDLGSVQKLMEGVSVYSFRNGMSTLTNALESALQQSSNVEVVKNDSALRVMQDPATDNITVGDFWEMIQLH